MGASVIGGSGLTLSNAANEHSFFCFLQSPNSSRSVAAPWTTLRLQVVDGRAIRIYSAGRSLEANLNSHESLGPLSHAESFSCMAQFVATISRPARINVAGSWPDCMLAVPLSRALSMFQDPFCTPLTHCHVGH